MTRRSRPRQRTADAPRTIVCFGEVLWDCLPKGLFLGGAPTNAAYHLAKQGLLVLPVTAVGRDFLGSEAIRRIESWGLDTRAVSRHLHRPTGTVRAALDRTGSASYEIARNVAWDHITIPRSLRRAKLQPIALVYGTLALRGAGNRRALQSLFDLWPETIRVVDLNFRAPFDTPEVLSFALSHAQLVKLNELELAKLTRMNGRSPEALARGARHVAERYKITRLCVTAGDQGAGLWWNGEWFWEKAHRVKVRDTVGAGDAFLGGLLGGLFQREVSPAEALIQACRLGEFVASRDGATPDYAVDQKGRPRTPNA